MSVDASDVLYARRLFTDPVGSTQRAAKLGDRAWRDLLAEHHAVVLERAERGERALKGVPGTWRLYAVAR